MIQSRSLGWPSLGSEEIGALSKPSPRVYVFSLSLFLIVSQRGDSKAGVLSDFLPSHEQKVPLPAFAYVLYFPLLIKGNLSLLGILFFFPGDFSKWRLN